VARGSLPSFVGVSEHRRANTSIDIPGTTFSASPAHQTTRHYVIGGVGVVVSENLRTVSEPYSWLYRDKDSNAYVGEAVAVHLGIRDTHTTVPETSDTGRHKGSPAVGRGTFWLCQLYLWPGPSIPLRTLGIASLLEFVRSLPVSPTEPTIIGGDTNIDPKRDPRIWSQLNDGLGAMGFSWFPITEGTCAPGSRQRGHRPKSGKTIDHSWFRPPVSVAPHGAAPDADLDQPADETSTLPTAATIDVGLQHAAIGVAFPITIAYGNTTSRRHLASTEGPGRSRLSLEPLHAAVKAPDVAPEVINLRSNLEMAYATSRARLVATDGGEERETMRDVHSFSTQITATTISAASSVLNQKSRRDQVPRDVPHGDVLIGATPEEKAFLHLLRRRITHTKNLLSHLSRHERHRTGSLKRYGRAGVNKASTRLRTKIAILRFAEMAKIKSISDSGRERVYNSAAKGDPSAMRALFASYDLHHSGATPPRIADRGRSLDTSRAISDLRSAFGAPTSARGASPTIDLLDEARAARGRLPQQDSIITPSPEHPEKHI